MNNYFTLEFHVQLNESFGSVLIWFLLDTDMLEFRRNAHPSKLETRTPKSQRRKGNLPQVWEYISYRGL